jgi:ABC-2 type transport system permease protein
MEKLKKALKTLKRYGFIYLIFIKNCLIRQMEYPANFFLSMLLECCFLGAKLVYTFLISNTNVNLNGLPSDSIFIFTGSFLLMTGFYMTFFYFNFSSIKEYVTDGSLDIFITKPVSLQFMTTLRYVDFSTMIPNFIGGIIILIVGWQKSGVEVSFVKVAGYIGYLISGVVITYSVMLAPQLLNFIIIKGYALGEIADALWDSNSMPMSIYSKPIKIIGTYVFPLFILSNFSSLFVLDKLGAVNIIWGIAAPVLFFFLVRLLWKNIIKKYSSASS